MIGAILPSADAPIVRHIMETITKQCAECGRELSVKVPPEGTLGRKMADVLGLLCGTCADRFEVAEQAARDTKRFERLTALCDIPRDLRDLDFDDYEETPGRSVAIKAAKGWVAGDFPGLGLVGPVGTGKTRLAAIAAWQRLVGLRSIRWVSVPRLIVMSNAGFGTEEKADAVALLTGQAPLVLDDLDKVRASESVKNLLFLAIDNRVQAGVPMLVTTNKSMSEIQDKLGEPIASRLSGHCRWAKVEGPDRRVA